MDLGFVIEAEAVPITLSRKGGGSYVSGKWVASADLTTPTTGTIQPTTGRQLAGMPEGVRSEARYVLWTRSALALDDVVIYGGANHRVIWMWPRPEGGFNRAALGLLK